MTPRQIEILEIFKDGKVHKVEGRPNVQVAYNLLRLKYLERRYYRNGKIVPRPESIEEFENTTFNENEFLITTKGYNALMQELEAQND